MTHAARVAAVYIVAALVLTWPLAINLTTRLGALQDVGDPFLNLWILGWGLRAWTTDPASIFSGRVFDANIFHPAEGTLAYSDHFLLQALALSPVYMVSANAVLCYNLLLIGSIALSGMAMHALARASTGSATGAYIAGLAWACWPFRTAHLLHIQLQALYFMPLALLCLHRVMARRRWRDAIALALVTALQAIASVYYGLMTAVVLVIAGVSLAVSTGQWRARRLWLRLAAAGILASVFCVPVLLPYARSQQVEGFGRTLFEAANHSASLQAYTQVPPVNLVYGTTGLLDPRPPDAGQRNRQHVEHQLFPGLVLLALGVFGFVRSWRSDARPLAMSALLLTVVGVVLSFGPEGLRQVYALLHDNVYGFQAIRAPGRFTLIAVLGLCLLAALGTRSLEADAKRPDPNAATKATAFAVSSFGSARPGGLIAASRQGLAFMLVALLSLEYINAALPLASAPPAQTAVGQWLAHEPTPGAVLHLPLGIDIENTPFMVQSLEHGRPIVNGYSGQRPAFFSALVDAMSELPSPGAFAALRDLDVRFVVSPAAIAGVGNPRSPLVERARLDGGTIYEVRWTPEALAALDEVNAPPPPPRGPAPFAAGEVAIYEVYWEGGPVNLPAGEATLTVLEGRDGGDRWQFETRAGTADWVSTFFQARDRFITIADSDLLPLEHRREIREGRRQVDRTYAYDRAGRSVRTAQMTLPLGDQASRDSLTALYYVRTLALTPGTIVTVPINEAGSSLVLQVSAAEIETIEYRGQPTLATRIEPRLMRRIERRRPVSMTLWLSADERRVPLRLIVEAGFGKVRLELVDYRK